MRGSDPEYIRAFGGCKHFLLYDGGALRLFLLANLPQIIPKVLLHRAYTNNRDPPRKYG